MRFALLGENPVATAVARAVVANPDVRLVRWAGLPAGWPAPAASLPGLRLIRTWEELLTDPEVDAVIIGESGEEWQPAVRQLFQAGKMLLVPPELVRPASFFYELSLFDAESPGKLFPLLGLRGHPLVRELKELIAEELLGRMRHVQLERSVPRAFGREGMPGELMTRDDLASALLIDADVLRDLFGGYDQVSATRSGDQAAGFSLATVTLAGQGAAQAVWTASGAGPEPGWKLSLFGEAGTAVLEGRPDAGELKLSIARPGASPTIEEEAVDSGAWLLERFLSETERRLTGASSDTDKNGAQGSTRGTLDSLWSGLASAVELVEACERSIRRRRTIDVHFETPSERGLFKTQMTAVGCSLLVLTLVAVVLYLVFEASIDLPPLARQILVVLIFAPLGVFLALQLLLFVARPATRD